MKFIAIHVLLLLLLLSSIKIAFTENNVYTYKNQDGVLIIGNNPNTRDAKKMDLQPINIITPYVGYNETKRRQILLKELKQEKVALNDAKDTKKMWEQTKILHFDNKINSKSQYQKQMQYLDHTIKEHEKNIGLLNKQLGFY